MHPKSPSPCSSIMRLHGKPARCGPWASNLTEWRTPASLCSAAKWSRKEGLEGRVGLGDFRNPLSSRAPQTTWGQRLHRWHSPIYSAQQGCLGSCLEWDATQICDTPVAKDFPWCAPTWMFSPLTFDDNSNMYCARQCSYWFICSFPFCLHHC